MRKNITFKTFGKSWYEEDLQANFNAFEAELTKNDNIWGGSITVRHFYTMDDIYKFMFKLRVSELFSDDSAFHEIFKTYYKPGFWGGYFDSRIPLLTSIISRAIEFPRSATAIALYTMIEERQKQKANSLQDAFLTNGACLSQRYEALGQEAEESKASHGACRPNEKAPSVPLPVPLIETEAVPVAVAVAVPVAEVTPEPRRYRF